MKRKMEVGEGDTSRSPLQLSMCLRVITERAPNTPNTVWYLHNVSIGDKAMPSLQHCYKDKVRRLTKKAKKRDRDLKMKMKEYRRRKFMGERIEGEEEESATLPPMRYTLDIPRESCWASIGTKIFCFGSGNQCAGFSNEVCFFNLFDDLEKGCEFGPPMMSRRRLGKAVTVDDKVYVFGGTEKASSSPWAEAFEKDGNIWRWRALAKPPFNLTLSNMFALPYTDNGVKKILFGSYGTKGLYTYCPIEDSTVVVDEEFSIRAPCFTHAVVTEKTIYWVGDDSVRAYNFCQKKSFSGRIHFWAVKNAIRLSRIKRLKFSLPFLHLRGDTFCLLWEVFDGGRECPRSGFVIHHFRILKRMDGDEWSLSVIPLDLEYVFTDHVFISFDGIMLSEAYEVAVPRKEKEENSDEEEIEVAEEADTNE